MKKSKYDCAMASINHLAGIDDYGDTGDLAGLVISVDRGMFQVNLVDQILEYRGNLVGTVPYNKAAPFQLAEKKPKITSSSRSQQNESNGKFFLNKAGGRFASWVKMTLPQSQRKLYEGAYRPGHDNKIVLIATTVEGDLGPSHWALESSLTNMGHRKPTVLVHDEEEIRTTAEEVLQKQFFNKRFMLTMTQQGVEWFILRQFRYTGTVAYEVLSLLSSQWHAEVGMFPEELANDVMVVFDLLGFRAVIDEPRPPETRCNKTLNFEYASMASKTVPELRQICKDNGVTNVSSLTRQPLWYVVTGCLPPTVSLTSKGEEKSSPVAKRRKTSPCT